MAINKSTLRTISILELIAKNAQGMSLSEIALELDFPITSTSDIVKALLKKEMIEIVDHRSKLYGIGVKAYFIGNAFISNMTLIDKAKPIVEALGNQVNKTVFIGKEVNEGITYIYKYEPENPLVATCSIGSRTNLHSTSLGKCIIAYDDALYNKTLTSDLVSKTPYTITDPQLLAEEIEKVRQLGYAIDNREQNEHLLCIGAPIFDNEGKVIAALSISGLYTDHINIEYEANLVKEKANLISEKMGYRMHVY
ncbi:IclR family transcriptional regulator [Vallitaleaceae bacterium 9-2]